MIRFLLPDLMTARGLKTAYSLSVASQGAIPLTTADRLVKAQYAPKRVDMETLDALCALFDVDPGALFEREAQKRKPRR